MTDTTDKPAAFQPYSSATALPAVTIDEKTGELWWLDSRVYIRSDAGARATEEHLAALLRALDPSALARVLEPFFAQPRAPWPGDSDEEDAEAQRVLDMTDEELNEEIRATGGDPERVNRWGRATGRWVRMLADKQAELTSARAEVERFTKELGEARVEPVGDIRRTIDELFPGFCEAEENWTYEAVLKSVATRLELNERNEATLLEAWRNTPPHDLVIHCPNCGKQHLDIGEFASRVHRKHLCENTTEGEKTGCGHLWVPFPYATRGVEEVGDADSTELWRRANLRWTDWAEAMLGYRIDPDGIMPGDEGQRERIEARVAATEKELAAEKEAHERTRVQLAGCGVAALGGTSPEQVAKPGDWGYSASYGDVLALRIKYEEERAAREAAELLAEAYVRARVDWTSDDIGLHHKADAELTDALDAYEAAKIRRQPGGVIQEAVMVEEKQSPQPSERCDSENEDGPCPVCNDDGSDCGLCCQGTGRRPPEPPDTKPREPGCQCHWEEGDSPCPVHGENEEEPTPAPEAKAAPIANPYCHEGAIECDHCGTRSAAYGGTDGGASAQGARGEVGGAERRRPGNARP